MNYLAFKNIPYAEPPVGELRFLEPIPLTSWNEEINNGSTSRVCPQMQVGWVPEAFKFLQDFAEDDENLNNWKTPINPKDYGDMLTPPDGSKIPLYNQDSCA